MTRAGNGCTVVCIPAFADSASSWRPLLEALTAAHHDVAVVELPGFGKAPAAAERATITGYAERVAQLVEREWPHPVTLVGHSLGSTIAVEAAHRLGTRCSGLVSFEGNLTADDAYFSGQAADHPDPASFKHAFTPQVQELVATGRVPASYAEAIAAADAETMWTLGRDARAGGSQGGFGLQYRRLATLTLYLWASSTTPPATQHYLTQHQIPRHRLLVEHHWPWHIAPTVVAQALTAFIQGEPL